MTTSRPTGHPFAAADLTGRIGRSAPSARRLVFWTGVVLLAVIVLCALWPDPLLPHDPRATAPELRFRPPIFAGGEWAYPLGTDSFGRDILSIMISGARSTLLIVVAASAIGLVLGLVLGLVAGYFRGIADAIIMRVVDIQLAFPDLVLLIAVVAILGPSLPNLILILGLASAAPYARLVRGIVLVVREKEFIGAAQAAGAGPIRVMVKHLLPNARTAIVVYLTYDFARLVLLEAALAFLGFGVQPPTPSWGALISNSREYMYEAPWASVVPGIAIVLLVLALTFVGDALRDRADPRRSFG